MAPRRRGTNAACESRTDHRHARVPATARSGPDATPDIHESHGVVRRMTSPRNLKQHVTSAKDPMDTTCINTIRTLSMDAVQAANSGHPGTPMALAPVAYSLWQYYPAIRPRGPDLAQPRPLRALGRPCLDAALLAAAPDRRQGGQQGLRDAGRAVGAARRRSRSSGSCTASARATRSIAGPRASRRRPARSGRAWPTASAWRIAERWLAAHFNQPGFEDLIDFNVYALCGDGDMMEGISPRPPRSPAT